jgi:hypothetical protein
MKKETPAPEQHPVDAYFREQETGIPVAFDPTHWDALQAMLDQAASTNPMATGAHVSDLAQNVAKPASMRTLTRLFGMVVIFTFLAAIPSTGLVQHPVSKETGNLMSAGQQAAPGYIPGLSIGGVTIQQPQDQVTRTPAASATEPYSTILPAAADTIRNQPLFPKIPALDSLSRQTDSLGIRKSLKAAQDSIAEQRKKKKHLFW